MKKFVSILSIFLFLSFSIGSVTISAQTKGFEEGFYSLVDLGLMENVSYNVQNISQYKGFIVVFDSDQKIQQAISLDPNSSKYPIKPLKYTDRIVILGSGKLTFTTQ